MRAKRPAPRDPDEGVIALVQWGARKALARGPLKGHQISKADSIPLHWDRDYKRIVDLLVARGVLEVIPDGCRAPFYRLAEKGGRS